MTDKPYPDAPVMLGASLLKPSLLWLLVLAPIAALLRHIGSAPAGIVFFCAALAIVPFAKCLDARPPWLERRPGGLAATRLHWAA